MLGMQGQEVPCCARALCGWEDTMKRVTADAHCSPSSNLSWKTHLLFMATLWDRPYYYLHLQMRKRGTERLGTISWEGLVANPRQGRDSNPWSGHQACAMHTALALLPLVMSSRVKATNKEIWGQRKQLTQPKELEKPAQKSCYWARIYEMNQVPMQTKSIVASWHQTFRAPNLSLHMQSLSTVVC